MLDDLRVLDLADGSGSMCGRILADLGADVIKIEPPGGDAARREPPYASDVPDADRSLTWFAANLNKRGITLDLETDTGRALFKRLVQTADVVIQTPVSERSLDYEELSEINPRLILATLTPYGLEGPLADCAASDLEVTASSGCLWLSGETGRPPVRTSVPQSPAWTGMYAAAAALHRTARTSRANTARHPTAYRWLARTRDLPVERRRPSRRQSTAGSRACCARSRHRRTPLSTG